MIILPAQIRAARAMLDWTVTDLGGKVGCAASTISAIETGRSAGSLDVLHRIHAELAAGGIEFTADGGVKPKTIRAYTLPTYLDLLDEMAEEVSSGTEVLKHCVDDRRSSSEVIAKVTEMRDRGVRERITISDKNNFIVRRAEDYRRIPDAFFASSEATIIYNSKIAFFTNEGVLVIESGFLNQVFRAQFEYWWNIGEKIHA